MGRRISASTPAAVIFRRPAGCTGGQRVVGRRRRSGRVFPPRLPVAWLPASLLQKNPETMMPMRCSPPPGIERGAALQQGTCRVRRAATRPRDTATNPAVLDAFALAIIAGGDPPAYRRYPGHDPTLPPRAGCGCHRRGDGGTAEGGAECRLLRIGEQLLRARLATRLLGSELPAAAAR